MMIMLYNILGEKPEEGTPIHYKYGYVPPNGVVILKLLIQNGVSILEAFSRTGYNISNASSSFVSSYLKLFKDRLLLKIRFNARVNKQTVVLLLHPERSIKNWLISRTGYQFQGEFQNGVSILREQFLERGANLEARAAHTHPKNTQVPPRGGKVRESESTLIVYRLSKGPNRK